MASPVGGSRIADLERDSHLRDEDSATLDSRAVRMKTDLIRQLRGDEGVRRCVYKDSLGYDTIGVGFLVDSRRPEAGLRDDEISYILNNRVDDRINALHSSLTWFDSLDDARKGVLLNMAYQMGVDGLLAFKNTLSAVAGGRYDEAAFDMMQSKWAQQTPERAKRLAEQMRSGLWQFAPGT
jgi:lysozyme